MTKKDAKELQMLTYDMIQPGHAAFVESQTLIPPIVFTKSIPSQQAPFITDLEELEGINPDLICREQVQTTTLVSRASQNRHPHHLSRTLPHHCQLRCHHPLQLSHNSQNTGSNTPTTHH